MDGAAFPCAASVGVRTAGVHPAESSRPARDSGFGAILQSLVSTEGTAVGDHAATRLDLDTGDALPLEPPTTDGADARDVPAFLPDAALAFLQLFPQGSRTPDRSPFLGLGGDRAPSTCADVGTSELLDAPAMVTVETEASGNQPEDGVPAVDNALVFAGSHRAWVASTAGSNTVESAGGRPSGEISGDFGEPARSDSTTADPLFAGRPAVRGFHTPAPAGPANLTAEPPDPGPAPPGLSGPDPKPIQRGPVGPEIASLVQAATQSTPVAQVSLSTPASEDGDVPGPREAPPIPDRTTVVDGRRPDLYARTVADTNPAESPMPGASTGHGQHSADGHGPHDHRPRPSHAASSTDAPPTSVIAPTVFAGLTPSPRAESVSSAPPYMSASQAFEPSADGEPLSRAIVKSLHVQWRQDGGEARLKLQPEFLGELSVSLRVQGSSVTAVLAAESPAVRGWIESHQAELRRALEEAGLTLDRLEVDADGHPGRNHDHEGAPADRRRQSGRRGQAPGRFEALL